MPNINISERDASTFADQQFISIAYNGKTNEVSGNAKVLAYRVTFISDNKDYCIVEVGENQKVNIPTPPTKEGYTFKNWLFNGEAFDFSTVITSDILLIAEFEEAPAPSHSWIWDGAFSEGDIIMRGTEEAPEAWLHKVSDEQFKTAQDYVGATIAMFDTEYQDYTISTIEEVEEMFQISEDGVGFGSVLFFSGETTQVVEGVTLSGTYFGAGQSEGVSVYWKKLTLAE